MVSADYASDPSTVGFLPPVTAQQALAFYGPVAAWLAAVRQSQASDSYRLDVALPPFIDVEPCPTAHLAAMRAAAEWLRTQAEATRAGFALEDRGEQRAAGDHIKELAAIAIANAETDYATGLWSPKVPSQIQEDIERHLKLAISHYFLLGQLVAMPSCPPAPARGCPAGAVECGEHRQPGIRPVVSHRPRQPRQVEGRPASPGLDPPAVGQRPGPGGHLTDPSRDRPCLFAG